jgi:protein-tyrosine-phosphatase
MVATPVLFLTLALIAGFGPPSAVQHLRAGFASLLGSDITLPALLIGMAYAGLLICTSLIFLDRRENTFCIPIHCGSSMLAGIVASYFLSHFSTLPPPSQSQLLASVLILFALLFLSPLHHLSLQEVRATLARWLPMAHLLPNPAPATNATPLQRLFLFVCAGNTSRSPIAEAICNAELARRLNLSWEAIGQTQISAISAGLAPRAGAFMTPESRHVLQQLGVQSSPRLAQALTAEMMHRSEVVYCMTQKIQRQVIELFPAAAAKVRCLDPAGDIEDPSGADEATYTRSARRIHELVQQRLNELGILEES